MSRRGTGPGGVRGDLATGLDLDKAAGRRADRRPRAPAIPRGNPWEVDVAGTRRLVQAVDRDRLQHLVYISIVGVDRIPFSYYRAKYAAEQVLLASGLPVTLLRVTQFHGFVDTLLETARRGPGAAGADGLAAAAGRRRRGGRAHRRGGRRARPPAGCSSSAARRSSPPPTRPGRGPRRGAPAPTWSPPRCPGRWDAAIRDGAALPSGGARGIRTYAQHLQRLTTRRSCQISQRDGRSQRRVRNPPGIVGPAT